MKGLVRSLAVYTPSGWNSFTNNKTNSTIHTHIHRSILRDSISEAPVTLCQIRKHWGTQRNTLAHPRGNVHWCIHNSRQKSSACTDIFEIQEHTQQSINHLP